LPFGLFGGSATINAPTIFDYPPENTTDGHNDPPSILTRGYANGNPRNNARIGSIGNNSKNFWLWA
jgi:hypothetical protein